MDYLDQPIYALIQRKYLEFSFRKYLTLFGALRNKEKLLIANRHQVARTELDEIHLLIQPVYKLLM